MRYQQRFIIRGKPYGYVLRKEVHVHEDTRAPVGYAYFCPLCGDVWAHTPVMDMDNGFALEPFQALTILCDKHPIAPFSLRIPGSLFTGWDSEYVKAFPDEMIRYEFNCAMKLYKEEE